MKVVFDSHFEAKKDEVIKCIQNFEKGRVKLGKGDRNVIKLFKLNEELTLNIKSFKVPNFVNQLAYKYVRKSNLKKEICSQKHTK